MTKIAGVFVWTFLFPVLIAVVSSAALAQTQPPLWRLGIGVAPSFILHTASFKSLPGVPQPAAASLFSTDDAPGTVGISAFYEYPLLGWGTIGILADYRPSIPATLTATETVPVRTEAGLVNATVLHEIDARLKYAGGEVFAHIPIAGALGVRVGPRVDVLTGSSFGQTQEITDPDIDFIGVEDPVTVASGGLPGQTSVLFSLPAALTYSLPLNREGSWQMQIEGGFRLGLTDVVSGVNWSFSSVNAAASIVFNRLPDKQRLADTLFRRDTTLRLVAGLAAERVRLLQSDSSVQQIETENAVLTTTTIVQHYVRELPRPNALLTAGIALRFVLEDGSEAAEASGEIRTVEEIRHVLFSPRMAYDGGRLFGLFNGDFGEEQQTALGFRAQDMQRNVLQRIGANGANGERPGIAVVAHGSDEEARTAASMVKKMCADSWGISSEAVVVQMRTAGSRESGSGVDIQIGSAQPEPFVERDTVVLLPVRRVLFHPEIVSEAGVQHWDLRIRWGSKELYALKGEGDVPEALSWTPTEKIVEAAPGVPIHCVLTVTDRNGQQQSTTGDILFKHSASGNASRVNATVLRFILHGREIDNGAADYIRHHLKQAKATPVSLAYWYAVPAQSEQPSVVIIREADALGLRNKAEMHPQIVPGIGAGARRASDIIDIRAEMSR